MNNKDCVLLEDLIAKVLEIERRIINTCVNFHKPDYMLIIGQQEMRLLRDFANKFGIVDVRVRPTSVDIQFLGYETMVSHVDSAIFLVNRRELNIDDMVQQWFKRTIVEPYIKADKNVKWRSFRGPTIL